jgi:hydrogenase-4 component B
VLTPVFKGFSVLAPTWLSITLPAYALLAIVVVRATRGSAVRSRPVRRAPVWVTGSGAELAAVQYRPSAYSNPMRVILRGPLGYRTRLVQEDHDGTPQFRLDTSIVLAIDRFVYAPAAALVMRVASRVRTIQSGRLSIYLLYMLVALIVALSLVPILR